jgi:hypothetical protein
MAGRFSTTSSTVFQRRLSPLSTLEAMQERHAALLDAVAEHRQQRRDDGHRADHRDRHDRDRADAERRERRVAGQEHAGHGDHHGQAGDQHGAAGGRGGDVDRVAVTDAARSLLALAAKVEERVVDADRQADEQHDRGGVLDLRPDGRVAVESDQLYDASPGARRLRRKAARPGSATVTLDVRTDDGDRPDVRRELTVFVQHS